MPMPGADTTLLRLMWLASPALPVGGFSYSEGLEAAVEQGLVRQEQQAGDWLLHQLQLNQARADLPVMIASHLAWQAGNLEAVRGLNDWVLDTRETAEMRLQSEQMGRSLTEWLRQGQDAADPRVTALAGLRPAPTWPLAFALASALTGAEPRQAALAFAFGWAENMAQAAIKAVPLGQAGAQRVLARLVDAIPAAVETALQRRAEHRQAFTPMLAILSARHEQQYSRLFRS
ncbi:MAG: urease accessory protein UreF [Rubrivivax sp.]|nr:urease accessory protein UreF [Rubrivivax sp.]